MPPQAMSEAIEAWHRRMLVKYAGANAGIQHAIEEGHRLLCEMLLPPDEPEDDDC
jgi:hypothetical protein